MLNITRLKNLPKLGWRGEGGRKRKWILHKMIATKVFHISYLQAKLIAFQLE